jgi:hypothetical protein
VYTQKVAKNMDIFDNKILCNECGKEMKNVLISKNGFNLRAVKCEKCSKIIIHPNDKTEYEEFMRLKNKEYEVKMRMVGNSYAVSIPREIVSFMQDQENMMNNMVKMCFEEAGKISLKFNTPGADEENAAPLGVPALKGANARILKSKEVKIIKNGKVFHIKQVSDSVNPQNNKKVILRDDKLNEDEENNGR